MATVATAALKIRSARRLGYRVTTDAGGSNWAQVIIPNATLVADATANGMDPVHVAALAATYANLGAAQDAILHNQPAGSPGPLFELCIDYRAGSVILGAGLGLCSADIGVDGSNLVTLIVTLAPDSATADTTLKACVGPDRS